MPVPELLRGLRRAYEKNLPKGWYRPPNPDPRTKWHYFIGAHSLCGRYYYNPNANSPLQPEPEGDPCKTCLRKIKKRLKETT